MDATETSPTWPLSDRDLRSDIRLLGTLLGQSLVRLEPDGDQLLALVEIPLICTVSLVEHIVDIGG